jgi:hypothetical protein
MKKSIKYYFTIFFISLSFGSFAQNNFTDIVKTNLTDATKLGQAYLNPLFKGVGIGLNSGWYNSAKAKNLGKFDVRFVATASFAPQEDKSFNINNLGLTNTRPTDPSQLIAPSVIGQNVNGPSITFKDNNGKDIGSFVLPSGSGINIIPTPQLQVTVGVIKNTDVSVRFTPKVGNYELGKMQVLGIGAKHEITSLLFPGKIGKLVPIDVAVAVAYNQIKFEKDFEGKDQLDESNSGKNLNQRIAGKFSGVTADLIISKKLSVFTPFASISYNSSKTDLGLLGDYVVNDPTSFPLTTYKTLTDPVKYKQTDISGLRGNVGFELRLAFFRLYAAYSLAEYQAVTAGIGFGIGK